LANHSGKSFGQAFPAHQFGGVLSQVNSANIQWVFWNEIEAKKRRVIVCIQ
jgi:hypothetical protein